MPRDGIDVVVTSRRQVVGLLGQLRLVPEPPLLALFLQVLQAVVHVGDVLPQQLAQLVDAPGPELPRALQHPMLSSQGSCLPLGNPDVRGPADALVAAPGVALPGLGVAGNLGHVRVGGRAPVGGPRARGAPVAPGHARCAHGTPALLAGQSGPCEGSHGDQVRECAWDR